MKISCPACASKYSIADDKVRGRRVKVRCKSCGQPITVDGTAMDDPSGGLDTAGAEDDATRVMTSPPSFNTAPAPAGEEWSVNVSDDDQRTLTTAEIVRLWHDGAITDDAFAWKEGMGDWLPILQVPELAHALGSGAAAAAAPPVQFSAPRPVAASPAAFPRPAAARVSARAVEPDLFGQVDVAGGEHEVATSAPVAGSSAYDDKPSGARNENSVLFSLDALKAGVVTAPAPGQKSAPTAPRPPRGGARPAERSQSFDDLMNMSTGSNPLFGVSSNQALMTAPPPPDPPPPPKKQPTFAPAADQAEAGGGKSKLMLIVGTAAVALLVGGGVVYALSGGKKDDAAKVAANAGDKKATTADKPGPEATKKDDPKPDEKKAEEPKADEKKPDDAAKKDEGAAADTSKKPDDRKVDTSKKPDDKKADDKKADDKKKPDDKAAAPPPPAGGAFNRGAAVAALGAAAGAASGCKKPGGPTGTGRATVTFAPSGRATNANVSGGAFGGTSVGGCVANIFRRAHVPPFSGDPVTVGKSFSIPD